MFWSSRRKRQSTNYNFRKLIDTQQFSDTLPKKGKAQIICDIDKTYLETQFESVWQMIRVALEDAREKVTVKGASEVLLAARWGAQRSSNPLEDYYPQQLHFVSASPPQMRTVLEEKLYLDGLDWNTDTFKNQAYNIRKARMDLLKTHLIYKTAAIMDIISESQDGSEFYLIGDNAESDTYIYSGIKLFCEKRLNLQEWAQYLIYAGVEPKIAKDFTNSIKKIPDVSIKAIFIRNAPGYNFISQKPLTDIIYNFNNFYEAALILIYMNVIEVGFLWQLTRDFHNNHGLPLAELIGSLDKIAKFPNLSEEILFEISKTYKRLSKAGPLMDSEKDPSTLKVIDTSEYYRLESQQIMELAQKWASNIKAKSHKK